MNFYFFEKTFSSFKYENFKHFFWGQSVSLAGTWMQQTALSWLIYDITGSKFYLGLIMALGSLPMLIFSTFGGVIADKYPKKQILIFTQIFSMLFAFILAFLEMLKLMSIKYIVIITFLAGIAFAIDMPVKQAFFIDMVKKKDLMNAIALNSSMVNAARMIGPAFAGLIMANYDIFWCFILNGLSFLAIIFVLLEMKLPKITYKHQKESILESMASGFRYVKKNKRILNLIILLSLIVIFGFSYSILLPAIAKDIFSTNETGYAMLVTANGLGSLLGALFIAYLGNSPKAKYFVNYGLYLFCLAIIMLALYKNYWLGFISLTVAGFGIVSYVSVTTTLIQSYTEDAYRGRVMGIWTLVFGGMLPVGSLLAGILAQHIGISLTLILNAFVCLLCTVMLSVLSRPEDQINTF